MFLTYMCMKAFLLGWFASTALAQEGTCQLSEVYGRFKTSCNFRGSFPNDKPYSKSVGGTYPLFRCASYCYQAKNDRCKLFHYDKVTQTCSFYDKYKDEMDFHESPQDDGYYYEKTCYSTSCRVIDACQSYQKCDYNDVLGNYYYNYAEFGCSYGVDAHFDSPKVHQVKQFFLPKAKSTCEAVDKCLAEIPYGSFVVAWFKPKKQWLCTTYDNACKYDVDCDGSQAASTYVPLEAEYIDRETFMHKNASIGATVAYWQDVVYR